MTLDGYEVYKKARMITRNIAFYLPRNVNTDQLLELAAPYSVEVEQNFLNDRLKGITAYFGHLKNDPSLETQNNTTQYW